VLWDWRERTAVAELPGHPGLTAYAEFSPDGRTILSTGADATLRVRDIAGEEQLAFAGIANGRPAVSDVGLVVVPLFGTSTAGLVDVGVRGELGALPARELSAAPGSDDECFVASDLDAGGSYVAFDDHCGPPPLEFTGTSITSLIDIDSMELRQSLKSGYGMALSPEGERMARQKAEIRSSGVWTGAIEIVDSRTGQTIIDLEGLCLYNPGRLGEHHPAAENEGCAEFPKLPFPILGWQLRWSPDGKMVAVVDGIEGYFAAWKADDGRLITESLTANRENLPAFDVSFTPDSRHILVSYTGGAAAGVIDSVSTESWTVERSRQLDESGLRLHFIGYSADASTVFGISGFKGFGGGALHWLDVQTLDEFRQRPRVHDGVPGAVAISPDRTLLATASSDGFVRVWESATGRLDHEISFRGKAVNGVALIDDRRLGVVLDDGNLRVLTIDTSELLGIVRRSLTRGFTEAECERFNFEQCPTLEEMRGD
jgi:WD40 repeat protein